MTDTPEMPLNGWTPFDFADHHTNRDLTSPHWLFNSSTKELAVGRRAAGGNSIYLVDRCDQKVGEADGFDWAKPVTSKDAAPLPGQMVWKNPLPVVAMLVPTTEGLLLLRRASRDTYGKIALPSGYQEEGETWQEAGCREVLEETGIRISPEDVAIYDIETVENGSVNLIYGFCKTVVDLTQQQTSPQEGEVLEVMTTLTAVETAFPSHTRVIESFFRKGI